MKFTKPAIDLDAQIALLSSRGLTIADGSHRFLDGVSFEDVLDLYVFDRKLRLAVMVEVLLKVVSPNTRWGQRLADLLDGHPKVRADRPGSPVLLRAHSMASNRTMKLSMRHAK